MAPRALAPLLLQLAWRGCRAGGQSAWRDALASDTAGKGPEGGVCLLQGVKGRAAAAEPVEPAEPAERAPHYWSQRGGNLQTSSYVPWTAPTDLSAGPSWVWNNTEDEQVRHSPLIDSGLNIYVSTETRIRKFSRDGALLWTWQSPDGEDFYAVASPTLFGGALFAVLRKRPSPGLGVVMYSIDLVSGLAKWRREDPTVQQGADGAATLVSQGAAVFGSHGPEVEEGSSVVHAVSVEDGSPLWTYDVEDVVWNFKPSGMEDGSLLLATSCGGALRIDRQGKLLWKTGKSMPGVMCSVGGGALGPDGKYYTQWSEPETKTDVLQAFNVTDGTLLWKKTIVFGSGAQYPAVGPLGPEGPVAVVVGLGDYDSVTLLNDTAPVPLRNAVVALDAVDGAELWRTEEAPWPRIEGAGDEPLAMAMRLVRRPHASPVCLPDPQAIPLIAGDGTVYSGSGHSGELRAVRDADGDGVIAPSEVSSFQTDRCFLNSPSAAPGMLVAAPCWGPMYVFLSEAHAR